MVATTPAAPGALEAVRQFVNTLDVETGADQIDEASGLRTWLVTQDLATDPTPTSGDVRRAIELREALRIALAANHDRAHIPADARRLLDAGATRADLSVEFTPDRGWHTTARAAGVDGALGTLLSRVVDAMADGTWRRLKVCADDQCRWAFYDNSRAVTGKWCTMRVCGNRAKQQAWRDRQH
ncbi:MAG: CGNR zinc finger domain-containing protein [Nocardioidaceae bacterium]